MLQRSLKTTLYGSMKRSLSERLFLFPYSNTISYIRIMNKETAINHNLPNSNPTQRII